MEGLLIVPYGIETVYTTCQTWGRSLLIVPYGIETQQRHQERRGHSLLIVPYGIETSDTFVAGRVRKPFNRTIWN